PPSYIRSIFILHTPPPTEIYTLSLHDALPILMITPPSSTAAAINDTATATHRRSGFRFRLSAGARTGLGAAASSSSLASGSVSEIGRATSELQSLAYLVCRLLLEKKKKHNNIY